jgi:prefoldin subunit 5
MVTPIIDPNAGKRASLIAQIKGLTTARDTLQNNVDNLAARIADFQKQLDAIPPPLSAVKKPAVTTGG